MLGCLIIDYQKSIRIPFSVSKKLRFFHYFTKRETDSIFFHFEGKLTGFRPFWCNNETGPLYLRSPRTYFIPRLTKVISINGCKPSLYPP